MTRTTSRRIRLAAYVVAGVVGAHGLAHAQTRDFDRTVDLASGGRLTVEGNKGNVEVIAWDQQRVQINARIEPPRDVGADYARRAVEGTEIDVDVTDRSVSVRTNYDGVPDRRRSWGGRSRSVPYVHYEIRAPRSIDLLVEADRGNARVEGFSGAIDLDTDRGELDATDLSGDVRIVIDRGDRSRLANIQGSLDLEIDRTDLTIRGLSLERDSRLEIDRGDVEIEMAATQALSLYAELSRRANLDSDFDITLQRHGRHVMEGTINGGGPELSIDADRTSIRLRRTR